MGLFYSLLSSEDEIENTDAIDCISEEITDINTEGISEKKGAYIFQDVQKRIYNFLYFKMNRKEFQKALPISYENDETRNYLIITFDAEGRDYLGQQSWEKVRDIILKNKMINLRITSWEDLPENYNIEKQEYLNMISLAEQQLK